MKQNIQKVYSRCKRSNDGSRESLFYIFKKMKGNIPPAQISVYVIEKAIFAFELIEKLEKEWEENFSKNIDASEIRLEQQIIIDAFSVYIASLVDNTSSKYSSLIRSYEKNEFIEQFINHPIVKECLIHRHNRAGHQSLKYGSFLSHENLLSSNLLQILKNMKFVVRQFESKKSD